MTTSNQYERSYGYKYHEAPAYSSAARIAKLIRAEIKVAVAEGLLPGAPVKYSVTSESYSGGQSISVTVKNWAGAWVVCDGGQGCRDVWCVNRNDPAYAHGAQEHKVLSEDAAAARVTLERIHNGFNHDGSDSQTDYFDVRYYGTVQFEDDESAQWRADQKAKNEAKKAARENGTKVGKVANTNATGKTTVHWLVENTEGKKVLLCGSYVGRFSNYRVGDAESDVTVNCSRCAKRGGAV